MTNKSQAFHVFFFLLLVTLIGARLLQATGAGGNHSSNIVFAAPPPQQTPPDITGTWSGTFQSKHADVAPFTMTVVINRNSTGELVGDSSLDSDCIKDMGLHVTVNAANIVLAGSDSDGSNITFRGTIDASNSLLTLKYILNGSASGRCESDEGSGSMGKQ